MPSDLLVNAVLAARDLIVTTWQLPSVENVLHSGPEPIVLKKNDLPAAIMELDSGVGLVAGSDDEVGTSAMEIGFHLDYYCWYVMQTHKNGAPDMMELIAKLRSLYTAFMEDRKLNRTVSTLKPLSMDYTGSTRDWPVVLGNGVGAIGGYVGIRLLVVEGMPVGNVRV